MAAYDALFRPLTIKNVTIRNRFLSTSHQPSYASGGRTTDKYVLYEAEKAKGGVGLVQFGGATTVSVESAYYYGQLNGSTDAIIPDLQRMAVAVQEHGASCTVQLTHGGRRERWDESNWLPVYAPSVRRELVHRAFPAAMEDHDLARMVRDFAAAAGRVREAGVDGVEISCIPPSIIGQFWSPLTNLRDDDYGGSLENRMRLGLEVLANARQTVGDDYMMGMRLSANEMTKGGLTIEDCVEIAGTYAASGLVDFVSVVGGRSADFKSTHEMYPTMQYPSAPYLDLATAVKDRVDMPVFHATRITDAATAAHAVENGRIDMIGMTRAFIADPHHVNKLREGREADIRPCVGATYCIDRVATSDGAICMHNVVTGREQHLSHDIAKSPGEPRRVAVVGGGPGGLEAARVAASRGHSVVLFEAGTALGGQLNLASMGTWRRDLSGIVDWLVGQVEKLGVEIRLNALADANDVLAERPDVVVVATGGVPVVGHFEGAELATTVWDVLAGQVEPGDEILVIDETGGHGSLSCAQFAASQGSTVELVTPDFAHGNEVGKVNLAAHMGELYGHGVTLTVDRQLTAVRAEGNKLVAVLENTYREIIEERVVDQVIGDYGTVPNDDLYLALKQQSRNLGEMDLYALADYEAQAIDNNPEGKFFLYRIGDAWASRNVHAAMFDAMRVCKDL
jgi:2,4-dienoyl-CoA reductase-like NADH-dependent reductase (Old Yellow Enzyme family)